MTLCSKTCFMPLQLHKNNDKHRCRDHENTWRQGTNHHSFVDENHCPNKTAENLKNKEHSLVTMNLCKRKARIKTQLISKPSQSIFLATHATSGRILSDLNNYNIYRFWNSECVPGGVIHGNTLAWVWLVVSRCSHAPARPCCTGSPGTFSETSCVRQRNPTHVFCF